MKKEKIVIKKYSNRRLYDLGQKSYLTLEELRDRIQEGYEVQVIDSKTGEDLTQQVLIQLILETQKESMNTVLTSEFLHQVIQYRDQSISDFFQRHLPNILQSYIDWQQEAQSRFLMWAKLGWTANQYSRDFFMPGFNFWGSRMGDYPPPPEQDSPPPTQPGSYSNGSTTELEYLRQKVDELENRLKKPRKQG